MATLRTIRRAAVTAAAAGLVVSGATLAAAAPGADAPATAATAATTAHRDGASAIDVRTVTIAVEGHPDVTAWMVRPAHAAAHSQAGILWLHWLGEIHSDRSEFLAEAIELAGEGVVSILPQGDFPWVGDPNGTPDDVAAVEGQIAAYRAALNRVQRDAAVDPARVAVVGHDYGAMYGAVAAHRDGDVAAVVLAAPDATWGNWFATFWLRYHEGNVRAAYYSMFAGLDPLEHVGWLGNRLLLQWAGDDIYIPAEVRDQFAAAAPDAKKITYAGVDHEFTTRAQIDRDAFLRERLGLS
jgi:dienelactone hydrolase